MFMRCVIKGDPFHYGLLTGRTLPGDCSVAQCCGRTLLGHRPAGAAPELVSTTDISVGKSGAFDMVGSCRP